MPVKQPGLSNAAAGKIPQICATSPASEKKIRSRPLAQPTIQGLNLKCKEWKKLNRAFVCEFTPINSIFTFIKFSEQDLKPEFRLKVAEWEVRKALAGTSKKNVDEIRQLMPDDFNKKLSEWELIKQNPAAPANAG